MRTPVPEYLSELLDAVREKDGGAVADYIPELAKADPGLFGVALTTVDGRTYSAGDDEHEFSIQSISKPFAYAAALTDRGVEEIMSKVSVEPSGEAFNELSLERGTNRPKNPMINAGAMAVHSLLMNPEASLEERAAHTVEFFSRLAGRELQMDEEVFRSELETTDRNMALAHMLRNYGMFEEHAHNVVAGYVAQCAIRVTVRDLAIMGATLANGGVQPSTGERVCSPEVARQVLAVMVWLLERRRRTWPVTCCGCSRCCVGAVCRRTTSRGRCSRRCCAPWWPTTRRRTRASGRCAASPSTTRTRA